MWLMIRGMRGGLWRGGDGFAMGRWMSSHAEAEAADNGERVDEESAPKPTANRRYLSHGVLDARLGIVALELNRPPTNRLNYEFLQQLGDALKVIHEDAANKALLICTKHDHFCSGLDYKELFPETQQHSSKQLVKYWTAVQKIWRSLYASPLVTIACKIGRA